MWATHAFLLDVPSIMCFKGKEGFDFSDGKVLPHSSRTYPNLHGTNLQTYYGAESQGEKSN